MRKIKAGIIFGGRSGEHDISVISASSVVKEIDRANYKLFLFGITRNGGWRFLPLSDQHKNEPVQSFLKRIIRSGKKCSPVLDSNKGYFQLLNSKNKVFVDIIFPVLHGTFGEDGKIQGLFEMMNIPYVGSEVLGSAAGMDKDIMKQLFKAKGLPVVSWHAFYQTDPISKIKEEISKKFKYPVFIKPANLGSSLGISRVKSKRMLEEAIHEAFKYDYKIIVEQGYDVREIECSVLGNFHLMVSMPGEIVPKGDAFYSYKAKYEDTGSELLIPAKLSAAGIKKIQSYAADAFRAVEARGMARVDFFVIKKGGKIIVNEINTIPGFTSISMFPKLFESNGLLYPDLLEELFQLAFDIHRMKSEKKY